MVKTGLDILIEGRGGRWRGKKAGMILHQASVTRRSLPAGPALQKLPGFRLLKLFGPEHGLAGIAQDQVEVAGSRDDLTGLPVYSLYGDRRKPSVEMLNDLDVIFFDLQDVGVRYYTFIWTMYLAMETAAEAGISFVVLDRPNPLGGDIIEGNMPDPAYASFVGLYPLPARHGLTVGELALYFKHKMKWPLDLHVVKMKGWRRKIWGDETGLPWVLPSPNMPTLDTSIVYAGMCLLEATNISEGRGTTRPFEIFGAPFINGPRLAACLNLSNIPGVVFRPCQFIPTFNKWSGEICRGVQIHVTDRKKFPSFLTGLAALRFIRKMHGKDFLWKNPPYEYETVKLPMDVLCGGDAIRKSLEAGEDPWLFSRPWKNDLEKFRRETRPFRLYP